MGTVGTQRAFGDGGVSSDPSQKCTRISISPLAGRKYGNNGDSGTLILQICNANYVNSGEL